MLNRRALMGSLAGLTMTLGGCAAPVGNLPKKTRDVWDSEADVPSAKMVRGHPNMMVFEDGPRIPMNQDAFLTLWEGPTFWLTYGYGRARFEGEAKTQAVKCADGTMQLLLITLAFAPERLEHKDGGWRLKEQAKRNYVRGFVDLPGAPFAPRTDAAGGFGDMGRAAPPYLLAPQMSIGQSGASMSPIMPIDPAGDNRLDAFTVYIIKKSDVDLAYVRKVAQVVPG